MIEESHDPGDVDVIRLHTLPTDAIGSILNHCSDFASILNLGQTYPLLSQAIFSQHWTCQNCSDPIFESLDDIEQTYESNIIRNGHPSALATTGQHFNRRKRKTPFMCAVCHAKFCGETVDYDKRYCRPQPCDGCGKIECHTCLSAHLGNSDGYGTENYCQDCQAEFDFGMGGC